MLIEAVKQECEEIAEGNNGRIQPNKVSVRGGLYQQFTGEIKNGDINGFEKYLKPEKPKRVQFIWHASRWGRLIGGKEQRREFEMSLVTHPKAESDSYKLMELSCVDCGNEPFLKANGNYYCPACSMK